MQEKEELKNESIGVKEPIGTSDRPAPPVMPVPSMDSPKNKLKTILSAVAVVCSLVVFMLGLVKMVIPVEVKRESITQTEGVTTDTHYSYYGGDAYTGMQQASADASNNAAAAAQNVAILNKNLGPVIDAVGNNAKAVGNAVNDAAGMVMIGMGLIGACYFGLKLTESLEKKNRF